VQFSNLNFQDYKKFKKKNFFMLIKQVINFSFYVFIQIYILHFMFKNFNSVAPLRFFQSRSALGAAERGKTATSTKWNRSMNRKEWRFLEMFCFVVVFKVLSWQILKIKFSVLFKRLCNSLNHLCSWQKWEHVLERAVCCTCESVLWKHEFARARRGRSIRTRLRRNILGAHPGSERTNARERSVNHASDEHLHT